ncbi:5'/3'-nucleotidase SurE [Amycolatopsis acidiphila]|uniref:5'-nucleotidase n=1 Tax=Amycolatopsis acidiphila TaxID=715473 RepID=A0A558A472_9PSEU|nr:5'/3'-nucleotidase SurE [Amycolatopsis acidiphila]
MLVTNDDGIDSPGLHALARCARDRGWHTVVAAPVAEASGTSAGLTAATDNREIVVEPRTLPGLPGVDAHAVASHPGLIALIGSHEAFGVRPGVLLSGVNRGANVGRAILHSGTVGAALTAGINGVRALAVSLDVGLGGNAAPHWDSATEIVAGLLPALAAMEAGTVLNLNVPDRPCGELRPLNWARLASFGQAQSRVRRVRDGVLELTTVEVDGELEPGTDAALLAAGHPTLTALRSVGEDERRMSGPLPQPAPVR